MNHLFVPYDVAIKLKESGFDDPCIAEYVNDVLTFNVQNTEDYDIPLLELETYTNSSPNYYVDITCSAPLYQQVIDWFEGKDIIIDKNLYYDNNYKFWIINTVDKTFDSRYLALNYLILNELK